MCTVSFIPLPDKIFIAQNRDEKSTRTKAIPPKEYFIKGQRLLFPQDGVAGGTWIACTENGGAAVLLNGAFEQHIHQPPYRKSRGLVFLDIIASEDQYLSYCRIDLTGIEPFTIILWNNNKLCECRWDGTEKHIARPAAAQPHTWSSVTLYDDAAISKRKNWFRNWQQLHPQPSMDEVIQFHLLGGEGDLHNDLRMNRNGETLTVSVTVMEIGKNKSTMKYLDLQDDTATVHEFLFTKAAAIQ